MKKNFICSMFIVALLAVPTFAEDDFTELAIENAVEIQLLWDTRVQEDQIKVSVDENDVTLTGVVDSATAKKVAEINAWEVPGVYGVNNLLVVSYGEDFIALTDIELKERVNNLLKWSSPVDSSDITVFADAGKVTLEGTVASLWQKLKSEEIALDAVGVYTVKNELAIVPDKEFEDQVIANIVIDAIKFQPEVNIRNIDVRVNDGIVTLNGIVQDQQAKVAAGDAAIYTTGVLGMVNNLVAQTDS